MMGLSFWLLAAWGRAGHFAVTAVIALLLIAILLPAIALMVLYSRKVALRRAEKGG